MNSNIIILNIFINILNQYLQFFLMTLFKRTKTQNLQPKGPKLKRVQDNRSKFYLQIEQRYQEGAKTMITHRRTLQLHNDTTFLALDLFRNYLLKATKCSQNDLPAVTIACVLIAAKVNEIYPPKIQEIAQAFDYFDEPENIIIMQAHILSKCDYCLPFSQNILNFLVQEEIGQNYQNDQIKMLFKHLADPIFLTIDNKIVAQALLIIRNHDTAIKKKPSSNLVSIVINRLNNGNKLAILKAKDLNI